MNVFLDADFWASKLPALKEAAKFLWRAMSSNPASKIDLIRRLMKKRLRGDRIAQSLGVTDEAIDTTPDSVIFGSSEATIVSIVEVYVTMKQVASPTEIFRYLEEARSAVGRGDLPRAPTLQSYVRYRLLIEHAHGAPISDESLKIAISDAVNFFGKRLLRVSEEQVRQETTTLATLLNLPPSERERDREAFLDVVARAIIKGYRRLAATRGCAPGSGISDAEILHIYRLVDKVFGRIADARGEDLHGSIMNNIVLFFLQKYQMFGSPFFSLHLEYEAEKYCKFGLREDYARELDLK